MNGKTHWVTGTNNNTKCVPSITTKNENNEDTFYYNKAVS